MPVTSRRRWDGCITYLTPTLASSWPVLFSLWEIRAEGVTLELFRTINPVLYVEEAGLQMREHFKDGTHFITRVTTLPVPVTIPVCLLGLLELQDSCTQNIVEYTTFLCSKGHHSTLERKHYPPQRTLARPLIYIGAALGSLKKVRVASSRYQTQAGSPAWLLYYIE